MASSSAEYLPQALSFLIANFQSFITVKLDSSNYFAWKTQIENALTANSLFAYANGSIEVPSPETQDTSGNKIPNPAYAKWETIDRMLMSCIIATVTPPILPHIVGSRRTCEVWSKLEEKYSSLSRTHVHDLRCRIYSLKKTTSMEQYLDSIKVLIQRLEASGSHMDDEELVFHTLRGLPNEEYRSFKQAIRTRFETAPLSFSGLSSMLMAEDLYLDTDQPVTSTILVAQHSVPSSSTTQPSSINSTPTLPSTPQFQFPVAFGSQAPQFGPVHPQMSGFGPNNYGGNRNGRNYYNGNRFKGNQGPSSSRNSFPMDFPFPLGSCQICGKTNHQAYNCYYRQNLAYRPPQFGFTPGSGSGQNGLQFGQNGLQFGQNGSLFGQNGMVHGATFPTSGLGMPHTQGYASQRPQALMLTAGSGGYPASQQFSQYSGTSPQFSQFNSYPPMSQVAMPPIGQGYSILTMSNREEHHANWRRGFTIKHEAFQNGYEMRWL
ncbi:hypothetical protein RHSIM_Rhsim11G0082500 [Rhododendron simsii]|uniref:Retrotransposon Copia-like N-terminal domain-containing protein n=1 Tax=Rhododendron simsii TaxID=118357 RepID=A0A834G6M1_RHOSS|nr:hypothetical protein RHSIM_Rhsim11G0082500 [Rhododendron simsii]